MKKTLLFLLALFIFYSCTDTQDELTDINGNFNVSSAQVIPKSLSTSFFDLNNTTKIVLHTWDDRKVERRLPWAVGNAANIHPDWIDLQAENSDVNKKMYTNKNGWQLVYSNISEPTSFKYIALYNRFTGILRFFTMTFAPPSGAGSSTAFWGIGVNGETSMLNFVTPIAFAANKKETAPSYSSTIRGVLQGSAFKGGEGMQNETWYAFEIECAYDPDLLSNQSKFMQICGTAADRIEYKGNMVTTGNISGTITNFSSNNPNFSLSVSDLFNRNSSLSVTGSDANQALGEKIDNEIGKGDNFFKTLWNNVKTNAASWGVQGLEAGAKKGIEAILSNGGSVVGDALGGLLNSVLGRSGPTVSEVKLTVDLKSDIYLESNSIKSWFSPVGLILPGMYPNSSTPFYNKPLGIWNLETAPEIKQTPYTRHEQNGTYFYNRIQLSKIPSIILNPSLKDDLEILSPQFVCVIYGQTPSNFPNIERMGIPNYSFGVKAYEFGGNWIETKTSESPAISKIIADGSILAIKVSFVLRNKKTNEENKIVKYFQPDKKEEKTIVIDNRPVGGGDDDLFPRW